MVKAPDVDADVVRDAVLDERVRGGHDDVGSVRVRQRSQQPDARLIRAKLVDFRRLPDVG